MQCGLCEIAFDREMGNEFLYNDFSLSVKIEHNRPAFCVINGYIYEKNKLLTFCLMHFL